MDNACDSGLRDCHKEITMRRAMGIKNIKRGPNRSKQWWRKIQDSSYELSALVSDKDKISVWLFPHAA